MSSTAGFARGRFGAGRFEEETDATDPEDFDAVSAWTSEPSSSDDSLWEGASGVLEFDLAADCREVRLGRLWEMRPCTYQCLLFAELAFCGGFWDTWRWRG